MTVLRLGLAALVLHLVLIQPNHPAALTWGALRLIPLELPAILLALVALPPRAAQVLRVALVAALTLLAVQKLADFIMFTAFGRAFNPVADMALVRSGWHLGSGALGVPLVLLAILGTCLLLAALAALLWWATGTWAALRLPRRTASAAGIGAVLAGGLAVAEIGHALRAWVLPFHPPGAAFTARVGVERVVLYRQTLRDLADFRAAAATDEWADRPDLLARLENRDLWIVFVESYGRASHETPLYAPLHRATLEKAQARMAAAGIAMRSGWLTSPTSGGQSWLAHTTLASGLRIDGPTRHAALLGSPHRTLWQLAQASGRQTAAVMPAITMPWPEAQVLGFDAVLAAADLGYRGLPFNWVTMPDQFTLSAFPDRLPRDGRPLVGQIALISSHAPWVPVPEMIPWEAVGDGTVFNTVATSGDRPDVVWRDRDRVRAQYAASIDYALQVALDWAVRQGPDGPLLLLLGDHQATGFVSLSDSFDVPAHLIGPPDLVMLAAEWGWTPGLLPDASAPVWPMEAFRDRFLASFSGPPPVPGVPIR